MWKKLKGLLILFKCSFYDRHGKKISCMSCSCTEKEQQRALCFAKYVTQEGGLALAVAALLHRRRYSGRRWRPEGGFSQHRLAVAVEQWDLDRRYRAQRQVWDPGLPLEGWDRRRAHRTTCTDLRFPGLGTRWVIAPSVR